MLRLSAKERKRKKELRTLKKALDMKLPRGPTPRVRAKEIEGRASKLEWIFDRLWDRLWPLLSKAQTEDDVRRAFEAEAATYYNKSEIWSSALVLRILNDHKFPKTRDAQVNFFADSLAGLGDISPRYSRDICAKERARKRRATHIERFEFYIECSCKFKGHSRNHACPKCGAVVPVPWQSAFPV